MSRAGGSCVRAEMPASVERSSQQVSRASCRPLLGFVQLSSERTLEPVRQDSSFAEKQQPQPARLLLIQSGRPPSPGDALACLSKRVPAKAAISAAVLGVGVSRGCRRTALCCCRGARVGAATSSAGAMSCSSRMSSIRSSPTPPARRSTSSTRARYSARASADGAGLGAPGAVAVGMTSSIGSPRSAVGYVRQVGEVEASAVLARRELGQPLEQAPEGCGILVADRPADLLDRLGGGFQ